MLISFVHNNNLVDLPDGFTLTLSSESGFKIFTVVLSSYKFLWVVEGT